MMEITEDKFGIRYLQFREAIKQYSYRGFETSELHKDK